MTAPAGKDGMQAVYDFWLGLIPQFFGPLGAMAPGGGKGSAELPPNLKFPADQVARAAGMTQEALQGFAQAYAPLLQAGGAPAMLGQWAAAMPAFPGMKFNSAGGASGEQAAFNPWTSMMPYFGGTIPKSDAASSAAQNPFAMFAPWMTTGHAGSAAANAGGDTDAAMAPLQAMQQTWMDMAARFGGTSAQSYATAFDRTFGGLFDALGLGPMRKLQAAWQDLAASSMAQNETRAAYAMVVQGAFTAGFDGLLRKLAAMAAAGERVESVLALMRLWAVSTEQAVHDVLQSEQGLSATAALARAGVTHRRKLQHVAGIVADALDMATRRDLDDAYREIQELKRELRARRQPVAEVAPAKARRRVKQKRTP
jgi:Poly(R)-hydroxyalkanoic acid synthase subunit (PHA_synth_III_E)